MNRVTTCRGYEWKGTKYSCKRWKEDKSVENSVERETEKQTSRMRRHENSGRTLNWRNSRKNAHTNKGERNNAENPVIERIRVCSGNDYVGRLNDPPITVPSLSPLTPALVAVVSFSGAFVSIFRLSASFLIERCYTNFAIWFW